MINRIQAGVEIVFIAIVVLCIFTAVAAGFTVSWFVFQPFKWLEAGMRRVVQHAR